MQKDDLFKGIIAYLKQPSSKQSHVQKVILNALRLQNHDVTRKSSNQSVNEEDLKILTDKIISTFTNVDHKTLALFYENLLERWLNSDDLDVIHFAYALMLEALVK